MTAIKKLIELMKVCPKCKDICSDEFFYCYHDGERLTRADQCVCGQVLADYRKFCPMCGKPNPKA